MIPDDRKVDSLSWIDERVFLARCQFLGKSLYYEGDVSYLESVNIETIKNALKRLKDMGLLMHHVGSSAPVANVKTVSNSNGSISWIRLDPGWLPQDNLPSVPEPMLFKKYEAEVDEADATIQPKQEDGKDYLDQWYEHEPKGRLWDFCERIGSYRREGKNRRDTSTVAMRVLRLARLSNRFKYDVNGKKKPVPIPVKVSAKL